MLDNLSVECCSQHSNTQQYRVAIALHRTFGRICSLLRGCGAQGGTTALVALFLGIENSDFIVDNYSFVFFFKCISGRPVCGECGGHTLHSQHHERNGKSHESSAMGRFIVFFKQNFRSIMPRLPTALQIRKRRSESS